MDESSMVSEYEDKDKDWTNKGDEIFEAKIKETKEQSVRSLESQNYNKMTLDAPMSSNRMQVGSITAAKKSKFGSRMNFEDDIQKQANNKTQVQNINSGNKYNSFKDAVHNPGYETGIIFFSIM